MCSIVFGSISKGASFTLSIACRLLYYLMELAILFNLGNILIEVRYRYFVAPHKYFNGVAMYILWLTGSVHVHACSQDLHVTFSEFCFHNV